MGRIWTGLVIELRFSFWSRLGILFGAPVRLQLRTAATVAICPQCHRGWREQTISQKLSEN